MGANNSVPAERSAPLLRGPSDHHDSPDVTTVGSSVGGLTSAQVADRLARFGYNEVTSKKTHPCVKLFQKFWGPMPWLIEVAAIVSAALGDVKDLSFLLTLLIVNGLVAFIEEHKAGNAIDALKASLAPKARVLRDGNWSVVEARELVPDDTILLRLGDVVPADANLGAGEPVEIDQSALTGESLPVTKYEGELVYQGSVVKRGELQAVVTATGANSFFGKAATLVDSVNRAGNFQKVLLFVARALLSVALVLVTIIFFVLIFDPAQRPANGGSPVAPAIKLCLVLLVASIPIAMQVVCTTTMAVGSRALARKSAVVARLSAVEELAGMAILCSDKTGTLTKNQLTLGDPYLAHPKMSVDDLVFHAALACKHEGEQGPIDFAICDTPAVTNATVPVTSFEVLKFIPFDPTRKRTEATLKAPSGEVFAVSKGSPQVITALVKDKEVKERAAEIVDEFAGRGYRTLGVARTKPGKANGNFDATTAEWEFLGLLSLYDPPRDDTAATIASAQALGIEVKMVTGDHIAIAKETSRLLGLHTNILKTDVLIQREGLGDTQFFAQYGEYVENADGFAEVMPEHKFSIVDVLQQREYTVGMTGDGVNDAPALKQADIGIAVHGATDAARAAADIVIMTPGLSVIIDAIIHSRMIFQRMKNYCTYRIACTTQILFFFFFAIILLKFDLPVFVICLISILNDGTIMSIAYDAVVPSRVPTRWELPRTCAVAAVIGSVGVASTFLLLYLARPVTNEKTGISEPSFFHYFNLPQLADAQVQALIYLQLSIGGQATIFVARTTSFFFTETPGCPLMTAFIFAQVVSTVLTVFVTSGLSPMIGLGMNCEQSGGDWSVGEQHIDLVNECIADGGFFNGTDVPCAIHYCAVDTVIGWKYAGLVWLYCALWIVVQDAAKLFAMKCFDMNASQSEKSLKRTEHIGNKQLLARASQASNARSSRPTAHSGVHHRTTRSTYNESKEAASSDMMLYPAGASAASDMRALPDLVRALEERVRELEGQLTTSAAKSK